MEMCESKCGHRWTMWISKEKRKCWRREMWASQRIAAKCQRGVLKFWRPGKMPLSYIKEIVKFSVFGVEGPFRHNNGTTVLSNTLFPMAYQPVMSQFKQVKYSQISCSMRMMWVFKVTQLPTNKSMNCFPYNCYKCCC